MIRNFFFGFFDVWKFSDELIETFNQFHRKPLSQYPAPSAQPTDATINRKLHKLKPLLNMVNSWSAKLPKCFGFPRLHRTINSRNNYRIINAINQKVHDIIRLENWLERKLLELQLHIWNKFVLCRRFLLLNDLTQFHFITALFSCNICDDNFRDLKIALLIIVSK